jgi:Fe-S-cluster containining protein
MNMISHLPIALLDEPKGYKHHESRSVNVLAFGLDIFGEHLRVRIHVRDCPATLTDIVPMARSLSSWIVRVAQRQTNRSEIPIACHEGCHAACCYYLTLLSVPESLCLAREVMTMSLTQRERIVESCRESAERARTEVSRLISQNQAINLADVEPSQLREISDWYSRLTQPCPFLRDRLCTIYENRPVVCREWLVAGRASQCCLTGTWRLRTIRMPFHTTVALTELTSELEHKKGEVVPLFCLFDCYRENVELCNRTWPAPFLVERFMRIVVQLLKEGTAELKSELLRRCTEVYP